MDIWNDLAELKATCFTTRQDYQREIGIIMKKIDKELK